MPRTQLYREWLKIQANDVLGHMKCLHEGNKEAGGQSDNDECDACYYIESTKKDILLVTLMSKPSRSQPWVQEQCSS